MLFLNPQRSFAFAKRLLPGWLSDLLRRWGTALLTPIRFSSISGHWKSSLRAAACTPDGTPLPWFTYPAIDFLAQRNFQQKNILEFGGGQSTLWWARRSKGVLTIEEDVDWFNKISAHAPDNVQIFHCPVDQVNRRIDGVEQLLDRQAVTKFDVIVIDGHLRKELLSAAFRRLAPGGGIIFDNSEGYGFHDELQNFSCSRVDFYGFAPGVSLRHCTSIVFVDSCFLMAKEFKVIEIENQPGLVTN